MNHIGRQFAWQLSDNEGVVRTFVDADSTSYAKRLGNMWLAGLGIHDDALLAISHWWAELTTLIHAFLRLTTVLSQYRYAQTLTSFPLVVEMATCQPLINPPLSPAVCE